MDISHLQNKRAALVAQRDHLNASINQTNANLNATLGAIAMVDELLGDLAAEESRRLAAIAADAQPSALDVITYHVIGEAEPRTFPSTPEMLPVIHEDEDGLVRSAGYATCRDCLTPEDCHANGCAPLVYAAPISDPA